MRNRSTSGLVALNLALIVALVWVTLAQTAGATQRDRRPPGEYTMVGARSQFFSESAIFVVDSTNQEMVVLHWDQARKELNPIGYRDLASDTRAAEGGGRRR